MATKQVKTYRVLRDGQKVGDSVRNFGDLMPEASEFSNLRVYLSSHFLEEIWVDQEVIDDFYADLKKSKKKKEAPAEGNSEEKPAPTKKRVTAKKKTTVKRKKVESDGRIAEHTV